MKNKFPQYLLDECVPLGGIKSILQTISDFELSLTKVGIGAKDEKVLECAIKNNQTLVTLDKRLAFHAILENQTIIFQHANGDCFIIKTNIEKIPRRKFDRVTKYILRNDEIILP